MRAICISSSTTRMRCMSLEPLARRGGGKRASAPLASVSPPAPPARVASRRAVLVPLRGPLLEPLPALLVPGPGPWPPDPAAPSARRPADDPPDQEDRADQEQREQEEPREEPCATVADDVDDLHVLAVRPARPAPARCLGRCRCARPRCTRRPRCRSPQGSPRSRPRSTAPRRISDLLVSRLTPRCRRDVNRS